MTKEEARSAGDMIAYSAYIVKVMPLLAIRLRGTTLAFQNVFQIVSQKNPYPITLYNFALSVFSSPHFCGDRHDGTNSPTSNHVKPTTTTTTTNVTAVIDDAV